MQLHLIAVGRAKNGPALELFKLYRKRLEGQGRHGWSLSLKEVEEKKRLSVPLLKKHEGELLRKAIPKGAFVIVLDERGKEFSSQSFAQKLQNLIDQGQQDIAFVIGGAEGLSDSIKQSANLSLCFGRMTWPHMLVRGLLAEQLYRAHAILSGGPYHRE